MVAALQVDKPPTDVVVVKLPTAAKPMTSAKKELPQRNMYAAVRNILLMAADVY